MTAFNRDTPTFARTRQFTFTATDPIRIKDEPSRVALIILPGPATSLTLEWVENLATPGGFSGHLDRPLEITPDKYGRLAAQGVNLFGTDANTVQVIEVFLAP